MGVNFVHISMACGQKFPKPPLIRPQALYPLWFAFILIQRGALKGYVRKFKA